jgi:hypothetical protein
MYLDSGPLLYSIIPCSSNTYIITKIIMASSPLAVVFINNMLFYTITRTYSKRFFPINLGLAGQLSDSLCLTEAKRMIFLQFRCLCESTAFRFN